MDLPRDANGDLDWNTLGNLLTARILGEVLHAHFVDYKYGRVCRETHSVDTSWRFSYEEDGIVVLKKVHPNSPIHAFMGRGVVELPLEEVAQFIKNFNHREQWDKYLVKIEVLRELSSTDFIIHMHHKARKCLIRAERDWLYYERACYVDDKFVMTALSVDLPDYPATPGVTRAQLRPGTGWVLEPHDGSRTTTLVSYLAHLDLMALPPIIVNRTIQRQVMGVRYIRDILTPSPPPPPSPLHHTHTTSQHSRQQPPSPSLLTVLLPWYRRGGRAATAPQGDHEEGGGRESGGVVMRDGELDDDIDKSGVHFEDPVSMHVFTRNSRDVKRLESLPWDMDHHWSGDTHSHTHLEAREVNKSGDRLRSRSEGDSAELHSIPVVQHNQHKGEESEGKGQHDT